MGWPTKKLGDVAKYINGRAFKPSDWGKEGLPIIRIQNLTGQEVTFNYYSDQIEDRYFVKNGDLLISWSATLGAFIWNRGKAVLNQHIFRVEENKKVIDKKFLYYLIHYILQRLTEETHGSTMKHITKRKFENFKILLPPLSLQHRIVKKIEELFKKIDKAKKLRVEAIKETENLIPSAVNEIFNRAEKKDWAKEKFGDICNVNPRKTEINKLSDDLEVTFVPMSAVNEEIGIIVSSEVKKLKDVRKGYTYFKEGDVLFAKITPCMQNGKSAIAKNLKNGIGFGSTEFHVLRPSEKLLAKLLHLFIRQKTFRKEAERHFTGTAGQQRVPEKFLENSTMYVPPIKEQHRIVKYLDSLRFKVESLKKLQQETQDEIETLKKSILDKAFKGELNSISGR